MFQTSTYFLKKHLPKVTQLDLAKEYIRILEIQEVRQISYENGTINYKSDILLGPLNRYAPIFSRFPKAQIKIVDDFDKFSVYFQAQSKGLYLSTGVVGGFVIVALLLIYDFSIFAFIFGIAIFSWLSFAGYLTFKTQIPKYFTKVRDEIERKFQN